jgi:hypothetical protein
LPNTSLSSTEFSINNDLTREIINNFKNSFDLLNYVQVTDDYDVKLYKKRKNLELVKQDNA